MLIMIGISSLMLVLALIFAVIVTLGGMWRDDVTQLWQGTVSIAIVTALLVIEWSIYLLSLRTPYSN